MVGAMDNRYHLQKVIVNVLRILKNDTQCREADRHPLYHSFFMDKKSPLCSTGGFRYAADLKEYKGNKDEHRNKNSE